MSTMSTVERGNEVAVGALVVRNLEWVLEVNRCWYQVQRAGYNTLCDSTKYTVPTGMFQRTQGTSTKNNPLGRIHRVPRMCTTVPARYKVNPLVRMAELHYHQQESSGKKCRQHLVVRRYRNRSKTSIYLHVYK